MLIIWHDKDLDGLCSAAVLHHRYPHARLLGYDYGRPFNMDSLQPGEEVIMADVSLPMDKMSEIADKSGQFVWIDHHISAYKEFCQYFRMQFTDPWSQQWHLKGISCYYDKSVSACEACWKFAFPVFPMPEVVNLLGAYDTWRGHGTARWNDIVLPFQCGMRLDNYTPESLSRWFTRVGRIQTEFISGCIENGQTIIEYQRQQDEYACKRAFPARVNIEGQNIRAIACNKDSSSSDSFESVWDEEKYDVMASIQFDGQAWKFSFRTTKDDIDCSVIAKHFGGGGHRAAAGVNGIDDLRKVLIF